MACELAIAVTPNAMTQSAGGGFRLLMIKLFPCSPDIGVIREWIIFFKIGAWSGAGLPLLRANTGSRTSKAGSAYLGSVFKDSNPPGKNNQSDE